MRDWYSLYEAKAKLSALVRLVREGRTVVITLHGQPVAELRPVEQGELGLQGRLGRLADQGIVVRGAAGHARLEPVIRRPGALARFLAERD